MVFHRLIWACQILQGQCEYSLYLLTRDGQTDAGHVRIRMPLASAGLPPGGGGSSGLLRPQGAQGGRIPGTQGGRIQGPQEKQRGVVGLAQLLAGSQAKICDRPATPLCLSWGLWILPLDMQPFRGSSTPADHAHRLHMNQPSTILLQG